MEIPKTRKPKRISLICSVCHEEYFAIRRTSKYCSRKCKNKISYEKNKKIMEGPKKRVNPYFLTRGDIYKNLGSGEGLI